MRPPKALGWGMIILGLIGTVSGTVVIKDQLSGD